MTLINLPEKFIEIKTSAEQVVFSDVRLSSPFKIEFENYISENAANGYSKVEWAEFSTKIITSTNKSIFLPNYWFYLASELAGYLDGLAEQRELFKKVFVGSNFNEVATSLRGGISEVHKQKIKDYFSVNGYNDSDYLNFEKFVSDYSSWGGGKTIDREDYFVSPLMKAGNLLAETQSAVAEIAKLFFNVPKLRDAFNPTFVPLSTEVSTTSGLLNEKSRALFVRKLIEFLLKNNLQAPLFDKLIEKHPQHGSYNLEYESFRLTSFFKVSDKALEESDLIRGDKLRFFTEPFEYDSKYYYLSNQWTDGTDSRLDIQTLIPIFNNLYDRYQIVVRGEEYILKRVDVVKSICLPKPFLLLAGISGTGKTRFVREQARKHNVGSDNFCLVPVRPDWHEPSDLLGYVSRIGAKPEYVSTKVLQFIIQAWCVIAPNADANGMGEINLTSPPYWLCLDEMNLAPVEQYFADYLSVLESRKFEDGKYTCDPLLDEFVLKTNGADVQSDLGLMDNESLWQYFKNYGIPIPPNLIVAGTVNMDETTHGFSRKVIDRALTIDFGEFFPNDYSKIFGEQNTPKTFTYSLHSQTTREAINCQADPAGDKTIAFLQSVNDVLKDTPFELAYRALNELLLHVCSFAPDDDAGLQAVWDDFLMTKILPRIDGDDDKLRVLHGDSQDNLLVKLNEVISKKLSDIWDADKGRIDLFREQHDGTPINDISCRSKKKIRWMINRLERNTFTSYWP
jgi:hypothetical protein